ASASEPSKPATATPGKVDTLDLRKAYERANGLAAQTKGRALKTTLTPHWFASGTRFWYRNDLKDGAREFVVVDADKGVRQPAFDHTKLAASLSRAAAADYAADKLPFTTIAFIDDGKAVRFKRGKAAWQCDLSSYACT